MHRQAAAAAPIVYCAGAIVGTPGTQGCQPVVALAGEGVFARRASEGRAHRVPAGFLLQPDAPLAGASG
jgi:hypothetical protein